MRKAIKIFYIIFIIILLKLVSSFIVNEIYIFKYEKGEYSESLVKALKVVNFPESYIAPYNYGNLLYENGKYADAIEQYDIALASNPPKKKECSIRINKALCILKSVDLENKSAEDNIEILYKAREILCEKGCANTDNDNGHSPEAEKLKKEIDDMIEKLKNQKEKEPKEDPSNKKEEEPEDENNPEEQKEIEEKLQEMQEQARKERTGEMQEIEEVYGENSSYAPYGSKNW